MREHDNVSKVSRDIRGPLDICFGRRPFAGKRKSAEIAKIMSTGNRMGSRKPASTRFLSTTIHKGLRAETVAKHGAALKDCGSRSECLLRLSSTTRVSRKSIIASASQVRSITGSARK